MDGASSHKSKDLEIPENLRLIRLPAYSPELNPQERVWDDLREKAFPNRVSANMEEVIAGLKQGLGEMSGDAQRLRSLTAWPWIVSLNLKMNWNYTYWLATTDARERSVKRLMQELHGGSIKSIIEELVRLTGHCRTTDERLAILEPYLEKRLPERCEAISV